MASEKRELCDGTYIPAIGLGTFAGKGLADVIKQSIDIGYRLFDTAFIYQTEAEIGQGIKEKIKEGKVKREDLYIVTKLWNTQHKAEDVVPAIKRSLSNLRTSYVDLYLVHWPFSMKPDSENEYKMLPGSDTEIDVPLEETWRAMEKCVRLGYAKSIGVSNFNSVQIDRILKIAEYKPVVNQVSKWKRLIEYKKSKAKKPLAEVECNPYFNQEKLREFCKKRDITVMAYSPFYAPNRFGAVNYGLNVFEDPVIKEIAEKYRRTTSQVILRYLIQCNVIPIPKSDNIERLKSNINIFDFTLAFEDFEKMRSLNKNLRCSCFPGTEAFKENPFAIEF